MGGWCSLSQLTSGERWCSFEIHILKWIKILKSIKVTGNKLGEGLLCTVTHVKYYPNRVHQPFIFMPCCLQVSLFLCTSSTSLINASLISNITAQYTCSCVCCALSTFVPGFCKVFCQSPLRSSVAPCLKELRRRSMGVYAKVKCEFKYSSYISNAVCIC